MEIINDDYGREKVRYFRTIFNKAIELPIGEIRDYLSPMFAGGGKYHHDLFCEFLGFVFAELKDPNTKISKMKIIDFYSELVMEGISRGRQVGYDDAKRIYSSTRCSEAS